MASLLSVEQRCKIAAWQEVYRSVTVVQREFRKTYGPHSAPSHHTILATVVTIDATRKMKVRLITEPYVFKGSLIKPC